MRLGLGMTTLTVFISLRNAAAVIGTLILGWLILRKFCDCEWVQGLLPGTLRLWESHRTADE